MTEQQKQRIVELAQWAEAALTMRDGGTYFENCTAAADTASAEAFRIAQEAR